MWKNIFLPPIWTTYPHSSSTKTSSSDRNSMFTTQYSEPSGQGKPASTKSADSSNNSVSRICMSTFTLSNNDHSKKTEKSNKNNIEFTGIEPYSD